MTRNAALSLFLLFALAQFAHANPVAQPPVSLTNPDGQALVLEKYELRIAVQGALSLIESEMVFRNPENRVMEGRFAYLLPPGAAISRFAKEVDGKLMEGEVVERLRAQAIYTQILHTMRDPALLEMDQGNRFSARVFPIAANGTVRLVLSYSQLLPLKGGERKLTVPMAGLPAIPEFKINAVFVENDGEQLANSNYPGLQRGASETAQAIKWNPVFENFSVKEDLNVVFKASAQAAREAAIKAGRYQALRYTPELPPLAPENNRDWILYFDTSASNADIEAQWLEAVKAFGDTLSKQPAKAIRAFAFDVDVATLVAETQPGNLPEISRLLRARHALGGTNLAAALKHAAEQARATPNPAAFVLVTDGIATLGPREARDIVAALNDWPKQHVLHALVIGQKQDAKMLQAIVERTNGRVVNLTPSSKMGEDVARAVTELQLPLGASFEFYDEAAAWIYPKTFRDVRPGTELIVFSELKDDKKSMPGVLQNFPVKHDHGFGIEPREIATFAPLLQREATRAQLDFLEKQEESVADAEKLAAMRKQRVEISTKNRVLCPLTSLLVLETENDYRRFSIDRTALTDVMVVGANGIELKHRVAEPLPKGAQPEVTVKRAMKAPAPSGGNGTGRGGGGGEGSVRLQRERLADSKDDATKNAELSDERTTVLFSELGASDRGSLAERSGGGEGGESLRRNLERSRSLESAPEPNGFPAPFAPAPRVATPQSQNEPPPPATRDPQAGLIQPAKVAPPNWIQLNKLPGDDELNALRTKVQANPRDRTLRNAYSDALTKTAQWDLLQAEVFSWLPFDPENPQVFEYLGKSATGMKDLNLALRAYTSIAEVAPNRAALLSRAGYLLLGAGKNAMAVEMFREALKNRKDDCNIYRGLAMSYWMDGKYDDASSAIEQALMTDFNARYGDAKRVLREELGYVLRAWKKADPDKAKNISARAQKAGVDLTSREALRVTLCWETDANDVDLHVVDPAGEECSYQYKKTASGLELYSDQTQGLGPEVIRTEKATPGAYHVGVNYFNAGPMGVSRGIIVVMKPQDGIVATPVIVPFCLLPGGSDMRHLTVVNY